MKKVFIVHGLGGSPNSSWSPWLMTELKKKFDIWACALPMPSSEKPLCNEWLETIRRAVDKPDKNTFLVGHSLGVPTILRYLESLEPKTKIGGAVLVSGPVGRKRGYKKGKLDSFFIKPLDFETMKLHCDEFAIVHGDNDELVPVEHAIEYAKQLKTRVQIVKNGGHLNGRAGFRKLPIVLKILSGIMGY